MSAAPTPHGTPPNLHLPPPPLYLQVCRQEPRTLVLTYVVVYTPGNGYYGQGAPIYLPAGSCHSNANQPINQPASRPFSQP